ncbi:MAG: monofunctional biosynthetic peptidoglycan transglycosylase [Muribaculaceae bacterium]|nr:monofunctional biosynthetic peptidoglycan transglycosylase [Muribaculaceae bacterium]
MNFIMRWLRNLLIFFFGSTIFMVVAYKFVPVYLTPLMLWRCCEQMADGEFPRLSHRWVPLADINHNAPQAVMASEDQLFLQHSGFDFKQIHQARLDALNGKRERGASTISQQTAKNVFLWQGHNWIRKGLEAYFTFLIEKIWGKQRIMEVYLNSIEMGDGIYGVEAVAQLHFGTTAAKLTKKQAALIASSLPNPLKRDSGHPTTYMQRRSNQIMRDMRIIDQFPVTDDDANE